MAKRTKRMGSPPAQHRKDAAQWVRAARTYLHRVRVHLAANNCNAAMGSALDYARATGRFVEAKRGAKNWLLPGSGSSLTSVSNIGSKVAACFKKRR